MDSQQQKASNLEHDSQCAIKEDIGDENSNDIQMESDQIDAKKGLFGFGRPKPEEVGVLTVDPESFDYKMSHKQRGKCIILNHKYFNEKTKCRERKGTEVDSKSLQEVFKYFGFDVIEHCDLTYNEVITTLSEASNADYLDTDCFICCILTHGEQGFLWAKDKQYPIDTVYQYFKGDKCPSLAGKPKIFFIQACQGDKLDSGVKLVKYADVADSSAYHKIPTWADFLIVHSTVPGYYAWRNTSCGSWFIQALTSTLREYSHQMDLLSMLTVVNRKVAYCFESCVPNDEEFDKKKQVSCVTSMLTRRVFFHKTPLQMV
ncbi:caspase-like protein, partial [Dinothrombium tinctorium]